MEKGHRGLEQWSVVTMVTIRLLNYSVERLVISCITTVLLPSSFANFFSVTVVTNVTGDNRMPSVLGTTVPSFMFNQEMFLGSTVTRVIEQRGLVAVATTVPRNHGNHGTRNTSRGDEGALSAPPDGGLLKDGTSR